MECQQTIGHCHKTRSYTMENFGRYVPGCAGNEFEISEIGNFEKWPIIGTSEGSGIKHTHTQMRMGRGKSQILLL